MGAIKAAGTMVLSIILGAVVMAFLILEVPDFYAVLNGYGVAAESAIENMGWGQVYVNVIGFLITSEQMVFLGLVIFLRIILSIFMAGIGAMLGGSRY